MPFDHPQQQKIWPTQVLPGNMIPIAIAGRVAFSYYFK
jgi:hypothetical protein